MDMDIPVASRFGMTPSVGALLAANAIPLFGVVFFGWSLFPVVFLYWLESAVVGVLNVARMSRATGPAKAGFSVNGKPYEPEMKRALIGFFILHYGLFTSVHGMFVFSFFGSAQIGLFAFVVSFLSLFWSHIYSYMVNFIGNREYERVSVPELFLHPYKRVVILHAVILFGGTLAQMFNAPALAVALLVVLKTGIDFVAHSWEHRKFEARTITAPADLL